MLLINPWKYQAMIILPFLKKSHASVISPASVQFGCFVINIVESIKILVVTFMHNFSWNLHVSTIRCKMNSMLGVIHRLNFSLNADFLLKIYSMFIASYVNYCLPVWGNCSHSASTGIKRSLEPVMYIIFGSLNLMLQSSTASMAGFGPFIN